MALSTARIRRVRCRPPLLAAGITSLIHSHSSSVRSLGYVFSFIYPCYTTHEDFSDRLLEGGRVRQSGNHPCKPGNDACHALIVDLVWRVLAGVVGGVAEQGCVREHHPCVAL